MEFQHTPIMVKEVVSFLDPKSGQTIVDLTAGGGGHLEALKKACSDCNFIAIDQDEEAVDALVQKFRDRTIIVHDNFRNIVIALKKLGIQKVDAALIDLGVSSHQLDTERGFSFQRNEPLDMRMNQNAKCKMQNAKFGEAGFCAMTIVNSFPEYQIRDILSQYGQERYANAIARMIVKTRETRPIETTGQLVEIIKQATPPSYRHAKTHHFATNTFRTLRMVVNDELGALESFLKQAPRIINSNGKLVALTFHSLEDRMVKNAMRSWQGKAIDLKPSEQEVAKNPRARSARLRGFQFN